MTRPAPTYDPRSIKDDDWILRVTRVGEKAHESGAADDNHAPVVEVTLTLSDESRSKHQTRINAVFAAVALIILFLPLPAKSLLTMAANNLPWEPDSGRMANASGTALSDKLGLGSSLLSIAADLFVKGLLVALLWRAFRPSPVIQESVVAMRGLGLQIKTLRSNGKEKTAFYDSYSLKSLLVHEGIQFCAVRYYAALVVAGKSSLVLLFENSRPRLAVLGKIYRALYPCLFPDAAAADVDRYVLPLLAGEGPQGTNEARSWQTSDSQSQAQQPQQQRHNGSSSQAVRQRK